MDWEANCLVIPSWSLLFQSFASASQIPLSASDFWSWNAQMCGIDLSSRYCYGWVSSQSSCLPEQRWTPVEACDPWAFSSSAVPSETVLGLRLLRTPQAWPSAMAPSVFPTRLTAAFNQSQWCSQSNQSYSCQDKYSRQLSCWLVRRCSVKIICSLTVEVCWWDCAIHVSCSLN